MVMRKSAAYKPKQSRIPINNFSFSPSPLLPSSELALARHTTSICICIFVLFLHNSTPNRIDAVKNKKNKKKTNLGLESIFLSSRRECVLPFIIDLVINELDSDIEMLLPPTISPVSSILDREDPQQHWRNFDSTVTALSFGFVATAVLVSMFLVMAIFERLLRRRSPGDRDLEAHVTFNGNQKLHYPPSPKTSPPYAKDMSSVLMPGEQVPTFIAHSAPTTTNNTAHS